VTLTVFLLLSVLPACDPATGQPEAGYRPLFLPVKLVITPSGVSVSGQTSIITPIGEFSIGAKYALPHLGSDAVYVVLRDRKASRLGLDRIYQVRTGVDEFEAVTNGRTAIRIRDRRITIDVTDGTVESVQFRRIPVSEQASEEDATSAWWRDAVARWDAGYESSWYKPFAMTRWAYDDSTIGKWYGLGFVWFLVRLAPSLVFGFFDFFLSIVFLVTQVAYWFFGPTGRNVVWGSFVLLLVAMWFVGRL